MKNNLNNLNKLYFWRRLGLSLSADCALIRYENEFSAIPLTRVTTDDGRWVANRTHERVRVERFGADIARRSHTQRALLTLCLHLHAGLKKFCLVELNHRNTWCPSSKIIDEKIFNDKMNCSVPKRPELRWARARLIWTQHSERLPETLSLFDQV